MSLKKCIGLVSMAVLGGVLAVGCSSKSDSNPGPADSGTPPVDSGKPKPEAGPPPGDDDTDAGDTDAASACVPADETGFAPKWHAPNAKSAVCSDAQITAFRACLKDSQTNANPASCAPFTGSNVTAANKACLTCIETADTAATYGPLVAHKGTIEINVAGCLALATNDPQGTGCAGKYQAASQCRNAACAANCPVTDDASFQLELACEDAAAKGTCTSFETAAGCVDGLVEAGGAAANCLAGGSFDEAVGLVIPIFCGGGAPAGDASTD